MNQMATRLIAVMGKQSEIERQEKRSPDRKPLRGHWGNLKTQRLVPGERLELS